MAEGQKKYEKPRNRKGTILRLGSYMIQYKYLVLLALGLTVGSNLLALVGPMLSGYAIDAIEPGVGKVDFARVFYYAGLMVVFYVVSSILSYILAVLMIHISRKVVYQMRKDVFEHLMKLPVGYFDTHQTGDIISRISYDIDTVNTSLANDLVQILTTLITVVGAFGMMIVISPKLILIFVFTVPLSVVLTKFITGKTRPLFRLRSRKLGELNGFVEEMISGQKTLKAYHQEENTINKFDGKNEEAVEAYYRAEYYGSVVGPTVNFVNNLSLALVSMFGALLFLAGQMRIGSISSFILYSRKFSGPINEAANIMSELQSALAAAERVFYMIDEPVEAVDQESASELENVVGNVLLENVSFGYTKEQTIIKKLNLRAEPGKLCLL
ncbi:MAG: ABC transporter ATP-binding protein [Lachnospiraceae bacterium]|nr:ABC transporter ATP-binding protein [Lachnospiraceae bacterium]